MTGVYKQKEIVASKKERAHISLVLKKYLHNKNVESFFRKDVLSFFKSIYRYIRLLAIVKYIHVSLIQDVIHDTVFYDV